MRKIVALLLAALLLASAVPSLAEDMGVKLIGGPTAEAEQVSLDDMKLNVDIEIPDYGILTLTSFEWVDFFQEFYEDDDYSRETINSGNDADFALLRIDITNVSTESRDYLAQCEVKVVFDDKYEYGGWCGQYNYNNETSDNRNLNSLIDPADRFAVGPMYQGHYVFGCTLPNAVLDSKAPLYMVITIDGNELTYNIRK